MVNNKAHTKGMMNTHSTVEKYELYTLSLWLFFLLLLITNLDTPVCIGQGCKFIGFWELLRTNIVPTVSLCILLLGSVFYWKFEFKTRGATSNPVEISNVEDVNYEHLTFLTTYIIPFISLDLAKPGYPIALAVLLIVTGIMFVKTEKFYANPSLAVLGYKLYSAQVKKRTGEKIKVVIITKDRLNDRSMIEYLELDERVYYAKARE